MRSQSSSSGGGRGAARQGSLLLAGAIAVVLLVSPAFGAGAVKEYDASIAPTTATKGSTAVYTFRLTNSSGSTHTLGSANFTIPTNAVNGVRDFEVMQPAAGQSLPVQSSESKPWTVTHGSSAIEFRAGVNTAALSPGAYVEAQIHVKTSCTASARAWPTAAKQANSFNGPPGNDFVPVATYQVPTLAVAAAGAPYSVSFGQQPTRTAKNAAVAPAVTLEVRDSCNQPAAVSGAAELAIKSGTGTAGAVLTGGDSTSFVNGVASFPNLGINTTGVGYELTAETSVAAPLDSDAFDIVEKVCSNANDCAAGDLTADNATIHLKLPGTAKGDIALSVARKRTIACGSSSVDARGSLLMFDPPAGFTAQNSDPILVTMTISKAEAPGTGVANFVVCKTDGADPDGPYTQLFDCGRNPKRDAPCISKRNRTGAGDLVIVLAVYSGDPWGGIG